jgi:hypothetical protein
MTASAVFFTNIFGENFGFKTVLNRPTASPVVTLFGRSRHGYGSGSYQIMAEPAQTASIHAARDIRDNPWQKAFQMSDFKNKPLTFTDC